MTDPRAEDVRRGYAPVARAYREHLLDELAGKPLDRAFLDAFAERVAQIAAPSDAAAPAGLPPPGEIVAPYRPAPLPIVDLGCGPGHIARYLASRGAAVEGLDLSPAMIDEARASHPGLAFRVGDMFELPYADASVAGVAAFYAIVHLPTAELAVPCREIWRVLVPGGLVALAFHAGDDAVHVDELFGCATSLDFVFHRPEAVAAALEAAGLAIEARLDRAPYPGVEHASQRCYLLARKELTGRRT